MSWKTNIQAWGRCLYDKFYHIQHAIDSKIIRCYGESVSNNIHQEKNNILFRSFKIKVLMISDFYQILLPIKSLKCFFAQYIWIFKFLIFDYNEITEAILSQSFHPMKKTKKNQKKLIKILLKIHIIEEAIKFRYSKRFFFSKTF